MELMIRAGGQQKPYTAPVYEGYRAVFQGLASQGWKAFFKGLFFRTFHQMANFYAFYEINLIESNKGGASERFSISMQLIKIWLLQCACNVTLNVFHIA